MARSFINWISSDRARTPGLRRRYPWIVAGVVVSFFVSLVSSLVYPGTDSTDALVSALGSRFVVLTLLSLIALGAYDLRPSILRWRTTLQVATFPSLRQIYFLLECKAKRQSYAAKAKRQLTRWGPLMGLEEEDEEDLMDDAERMRTFLPVIVLSLIPILAALVGTFMALFVFHGNVVLLLLSIVLLEWGIRVGLDWILPPTILFLAASHEQQIELKAALTLLCYPLYMISFLETNWIYDDQNIPKTPFHEAMLYSEFRTSDDSDWGAMVRRWIEIVPLVIVDCRVLSPAVTQEMHWVVSSRLFHKAIFVINASDVSLPPEVVWKAKVLTTDELMEFVSFSLTSHLTRLRDRTLPQKLLFGFLCAFSVFSMSLR